MTVAGAAVPGPALGPLPPRPPGGTAFAHVRDALGATVVAGGIEPGRVLTVEEVVVTTGASRSVVREAMGVLASMGLLSPRRRVGFTVEPQGRWNLVDPLLIRWGLDGPDRDRWLRDLAELRLGLEPEAARLAALRIGPEAVADLVAAAERMFASREDPEAFYEADARFHRALLEAAGNPLFAHLVDVVLAVLRERASHEPPSPEEDVRMHLDLARHVQARASDEAAVLMREIVGRTAPGAQPRGAAPPRALRARRASGRHNGPL